MPLWTARCRRLHQLALAPALALSAFAARAEPGDNSESLAGERVTSKVEPSVRPRGTLGDGVYGRFDGDLDLGAGAGVHWDGDFAPALSVSGHWYSTLGLLVQYADRFGQGDDGDARSLALSVDVRPLFLPRWQLDLERGPAWLDLTIDSLSASLGYYWTRRVAPGGPAFGAERGLQAAVGLGVPLGGDASGLWLRARGQLRWFEADADSSLLLVLTWQSLVVSPWLPD